MMSAYWQAYGGWSALFASNYFRASFIVAAVLYPAWQKHLWWADVLQIIPSILGFSLGGFAMWLAVGSEDFRHFLSGGSDDGSASPAISINATFVHFIFVQFLSLLLAVFGKAYYFVLGSEHFVRVVLGPTFEYVLLIGSYIGFTTFIYALFTAWAVTLAIFRASRWYDQFVTSQKQKED